MAVWDDEAPVVRSHHDPIPSVNMSFSGRGRSTAMRNGGPCAYRSRTPSDLSGITPASVSSAFPFAAALDRLPSGQ